MRNELLILLILILIPPSMVSADVLPPGAKGISYCFRITNVDNYPDYTFIAYHYRGPTGGYAIINKDSCVTFYQISNPAIYAIKKSDFNEAEIPKDWNEEKTFFDTNQNLIPSGIELGAITAVPENDPREKIVDVLEIISVSENNLELKKTKVIYTYTDGTFEEKTYTNQDTRPEASRKSSPLTGIPLVGEKVWSFVLPAIALILIVAILLIRKFRK